MSTTTTGFVTAPDGVRLHYESMGEGAGLVVAPNGTYLRDELAPLARSRRVVCFDLRNRGQSDATDTGGILEDVNDTFAVINHFTDGPVDVIGHSFAGLLVALVARHHASRVRNAVLIGPLGMDPNREFAPPLSNRDETFDRVMRGLGALLPRQAEVRAGGVLQGGVGRSSPAVRDRPGGRASRQVGTVRPAERAQRNALFQRGHAAVDPRAHAHRRGLRSRAIANADRAWQQGSQRTVRRRTRVGDGVAERAPLDC